MIILLSILAKSLKPHLWLKTTENELLLRFGLDCFISFIQIPNIESVMKLAMSGHGHANETLSCLVFVNKCKSIFCNNNRNNIFEFIVSHKLHCFLIDR